MEHTELIDALGKRLGSRQDAVDALDALIEVIVREVATGGRVALSGFGVFDTTGSGGRVAPQPRFRAGSVFKELVAQSGAPVPHPIETHEEGAEGEGQTQPGQRRAPTTGDAARLLPHAAPARAGSLHFSHYDLPAGVSLSAVLPEDSPRCGIYVLCFDDGQFYVGQARDVLGRFADHRRRWTDRITGLDFAPALLKDLNDLERRVIQRFEREDRHLINSALVGLPMGESPLDVFVDRVEQERWLDEPAEAAYDLIGERVALAAGRHRTGVKYHRLASRDDYQGIRGALFGYLMEVVPWPHETERRFWSMTSLPSTKRSRDGRRLSVVTVNNVETLVVSEVLEQGKWVLGGFMNVAPGVGSASGLLVKRNNYRTIGDVDTIIFLGWDGLIELLQRPHIVALARRTTLGLMRKGRGMMAKYHDESLADDVFGVAEPFEPTQLQAARI